VRLAYQGEPGAYSEEAALALFPEAVTSGYRTFGQVFQALGCDHAETAVLPVENSLAGVVQEVNDLLWETAGVQVTAEHVHPVRHCLLGRSDEPVSRAISHPQALAQCRLFLEENGIEGIPFYDTAGAARQVATATEPGTAAIASAAAARRHGLEVLAEGIQDDASNRTRFLVLVRGNALRPEEAGPGHKASLAFMAAHRPGSLVTALEAFSSRGVNLTRLDSRPVRDQPFHYRFYLDFEVDDAGAAGAALSQLEETAVEVRLFGTYRAACAAM
jgi:prephenate dehydratase